MSPVMWHVTSVRNRDSIEQFGLDASRMGAARGIAGSRKPEADGVFLCLSRFDVDWFVGFARAGELVDVWAVDGVEEADLQSNGSGYYYLPGTIVRARISLVERDRQPGAYGSTLTITLDDGTVLSDDEARARLGR